MPTYGEDPDIMVAGAGGTNLVSRLATWVVPAYLLAKGYHGVPFVALLLGALDGWCRLWAVRGAHGLAAHPDGLIITSGILSRRVPWENVVAIETWRSLRWLNYVAVHLREAGELRFVACGQQLGYDRLVAFVQACAERVEAQAPRETIERVSVRNRALWSSVALHFAADVLLATLVGAWLRVPGAAARLGLVSAALSTLLALKRIPLRHAVLVAKGGKWWSDGESASLRAVPPSLALWVSSLEAARPRAR